MGAELVDHDESPTRRPAIEAQQFDIPPQSSSSRTCIGLPGNESAAIAEATRPVESNQEIIADLRAPDSAAEHRSTMKPQDASQRMHGPVVADSRPSLISSTPADQTQGADDSIAGQNHPHPPPILQLPERHEQVTTRAIRPNQDGPAVEHAAVWEQSNPVLKLPISAQPVRLRNAAILLSCDQSSNGQAEQHQEPVLPMIRPSLEQQVDLPSNAIAPSQKEPASEPAPGQKRSIVPSIRPVPERQTELPHVAIGIERPSLDRLPQIAAPETVVQVTIGRIEVRATQPPTRAAAEKRQRTGLRLDEYLRRHGGGR